MPASNRRLPTIAVTGCPARRTFSRLLLLTCGPDDTPAARPPVVPVPVAKVPVRRAYSQAVARVRQGYAPGEHSVYG